MTERPGENDNDQPDLRPRQITNVETFIRAIPKEYYIPLVALCVAVIIATCYRLSGGHSLGYYLGPDFSLSFGRLPGDITYCK
jgi:hypothetical protein